MTQKQQLLALFHENGNSITLGTILQTTLAAEYRARISELRNDGYDIPRPALNRKEPSKNLYTLRET